MAKQYFCFNPFKGCKVDWKLQQQGQKQKKKFTIIIYCGYKMELKNKKEDGNKIKNLNRTLPILNHSFMFILFQFIYMWFYATMDWKLHHYWSFVLKSVLFQEHFQVIRLQGILSIDLFRKYQALIKNNKSNIWHIDYSTAQTCYINV